MPDICPRRGTTLPELALMLATAGVLLSLATPGVRRALDRSAVVSAREELVALAHHGRALAPNLGGATLRLHRSTGVAELLDGEGLRRASVDLSERGVEVRSSGTAEVIDIRWNALGWGIVASRTLILERGRAAARLVVSSRGRVSRR